MIAINLDGMQVPVDVTYHDSNEEPEERCVNRMISFSGNGRVYQYLNVEFNDACAKIAGCLSLQGLPSQKIICVVTQFRESVFIEWPTVERHVA